MWALLRFKNKKLLLFEVFASLLMLFLPRYLALVIWLGVLFFELLNGFQRIFKIQNWLQFVWFTIWALVLAYIWTGEWESRFMFFILLLVTFFIFRIYEEFRIFKLHIAGVIALELEIFLFMLLGALYYLVVRNFYLAASINYPSFGVDLGLIWLALLFAEISDLPYKFLVLVFIVLLLFGHNSWVWDFGIYSAFLISYFAKYLSHIYYGVENFLGVKMGGSASHTYVYQLLFLVLLIAVIVKLFINF